MTQAPITIALCFAVAVLDGFDTQAIGVAAPRLAAELGLNSAPDRRGATATMMFCGLPCGGGSVALISWLTPQQDWRQLFLIGGRCGLVGRDYSLAGRPSDGARRLPGRPSRRALRWRADAGFVAPVGRVPADAADPLSGSQLVAYARHGRGFPQGASQAALWFNAGSIAGTLVWGRLGSVAGPLVGGYMLAGGQSADRVVLAMAPAAIVAGVAVFVFSFVGRPAVDQGF